MGQAITIPLSVIVARERIEHLWQVYRWRPLRVQLDAPTAGGGWLEASTTAKSVQFHAATLPLHLSRKETIAYRVNLANGEPSIYVVLKEDAGAGSNPVCVQLVTASPFEAQAHGELGIHRVEAVPMPDRLVALVQDFIDDDRLDVGLLSRRCERGLAPGEPELGGEPIFVMGDRMAGEPLSVTRTQPPDDQEHGKPRDRD